MSETRTALLRWGSKAAFAVLDQGFFAGSGFLANIMLARWLAPESFGAFAVAYSVFSFLGTLYTQTLIAPMLVFGAGRCAGGFRQYLGILGFGHVAATVAISFILAGAAAIVWQFGSVPMALALLGFAVAAPFILWLWLARAAFYVRFQPQWAALGSALYLLTVPAGIFALYRWQRLSPASGALVMGCSSLVLGAVLTVMLGPQWRNMRGLVKRPERGPGDRVSGAGSAADDEEGIGPEVRMVVHDHLRYAGWASAASGTGWLVSNLHYFVLSSIAGLGSVAVMRVLDTALSPYSHFQAALTRLLVPALAARAKNPGDDLLPFVFRVSLLWGSQAVVVYLLIRVFAPNVISLLYGGAYSQYGSLLGWYGLILIPAAIGEPLMSLLRAMVRTDLVFMYQLLLSAALLLGYFFAAHYGLLGIIFVLIVVNYGVLPVVVLFAKAVCTSKIPEDSVPHLVG